MVTAPFIASIVKEITEKIIVISWWCTFILWQVTGEVVPCSLCFLCQPLNKSSSLWWIMLSMITTTECDNYSWIFKHICQKYLFRHLFIFVGGEKLFYFFGKLPYERDLYFKSWIIAFSNIVLLPGKVISIVGGWDFPHIIINTLRYDMSEIFISFHLLKLSIWS